MMENMHYTSIMVKDTSDWAQIVNKLTTVDGHEVTARLQKKQKNGLLILIGSSDKDTLKLITQRACKL